jgi:hypothetical protein
MTRIGSVPQLLVTAYSVPSLPILVNLMMEAIRFSKTSVLTRAPSRNIPEDGSLHNHHLEIRKSYSIALFFIIAQKGYQ